MGEIIAVVVYLAGLVLAIVIWKASSDSLDEEGDLMVCILWPLITLSFLLYAASYSIRWIIRKLS